MSAADLALALGDATRTAERIRSLARAAELVQTGSGLADRQQADTIVIDLLDVIADLSGRIEAMSPLAGR